MPVANVHVNHFLRLAASRFVSLTTLRAQRSLNLKTTIWTAACTEAAACQSYPAIQLHFEVSVRIRIVGEGHPAIVVRGRRIPARPRSGRAKLIFNPFPESAIIGRPAKVDITATKTGGNPVRFRPEPSGLSERPCNFKRELPGRGDRVSIYGPNPQVIRRAPPGARKTQGITAKPVPALVKWPNSLQVRELNPNSRQVGNLEECCIMKH